MSEKKTVTEFVHRNPFLSSLAKLFSPNHPHRDDPEQAESATPEPPRRTNAILKGSKLVGSIHIAHDLEITGDVEGNITSDADSHIVIRGTCKGNIRTRGGSVEIEGEMSEGDIVAGGSVTINGKFKGKRIEAGQKILVNGEFSGTLESDEIEVGKAARGKGDLYFREAISIHRGAQMEGQIVRVKEGKKEAKRPSESNVIELERPLKKSEAGG